MIMSWNNDENRAFRETVDSVNAQEVAQMSKYQPLWEFVQKSKEPSLQLSFDAIQQITGFKIDHSFLNYKKELLSYGYQVGKISLKQQTVNFIQSE